MITRPASLGAMTTNGPGATQERTIPVPVVPPTQDLPQAAGEAPKAVLREVLKSLRQEGPEPAADGPPSPAPPPDPAARRSVGRLVGVDLARGLAVFGMYAAHVGPDPAAGGVTGFVMELAHGRASALFAFLAGFSIVLITGRRDAATGGRVPRTGREGRQAVARVLIRAAVLLVLGTALTATGTPVEVILAYYGLYFVLVLPLYRLDATALAAVAAGTALVLPQVLYAAQRASDRGWLDPFTSLDPLARVTGTGGFADLFVTGSYPALSWVSFVIAGMAVARLDLTATATRLRLGATGVALAVLGHGGSWLALHLVPGAAGALADSAGGGWYGSDGVEGGFEAADPAGTAWWSDVAGYPSGDTPAWLLVASPHSETTLSILGSTGIALAVLVACLAATDALPHLRRVAAPVVAVGSMSLTAYVFHILAIGALGIDDLPGSSLRVLAAFVVAAAVLAFAWSRLFPRGPLEYLLHGVTRVARHVR